MPDTRSWCWSRHRLPRRQLRALAAAPQGALADGTASAPLALAAPPREGLRHPGGGTATGAASLLVIATVVNAGKPGTLTTHVMLAVWAVASVIGMLFIAAPVIRGW